MFRTNYNVHSLSQDAAQATMQVSLNQQFIVYDAKKPLYFLSNIEDAIDCLLFLRKNKIQSHMRCDKLEIHMMTILPTHRNTRLNDYDFLARHKTGQCIEHVIFTWDELSQHIVHEQSLHEQYSHEQLPTVTHSFQHNSLSSKPQKQVRPSYDEHNRIICEDVCGYNNFANQSCYRRNVANEIFSSNKNPGEILHDSSQQRFANTENDYRSKQNHYSHPNDPTPMGSYHRPADPMPMEHHNTKPTHYRIQQNIHQHGQGENRQQPPVQNKNELDLELVKLTKLLSKVSEQSTTKTVVDELEDIYTDVQEEAELDAEIKSTKTKLDKACAEKRKRRNGIFDDINDINDETVFSDSEKDSDSDKDLDKDSDSDSEESETHEDIDFLKVSKKNPAELNALIGTRNIIKSEINKQEIVVNKANEKLNEDLFVKRCEDQKKRKEEQKNNERLSIFAADKNTYLVMQSKVNRGILKETNVSPFFNHKYHIIKFMETEKLISLKSNSNVKEEAHIFNQLHKVIDAYDYDNTSDSDDRDPMDEIEESYLPLCEKFLEIVANSENPIISEKKVHDILNNNPEIKKAVFKETADQTVFEKDSSKEEHKQDNETNIHENTESRYGRYIK